MRYLSHEEKCGYGLRRSVIVLNKIQNHKPEGQDRDDRIITDQENKTTHKKHNLITISRKIFIFTDQRI